MLYTNKNWKSYCSDFKDGIENIELASYASSHYAGNCYHKVKTDIGKGTKMIFGDYLKRISKLVLHTPLAFYYSYLMVKPYFHSI